MKTQLFRGTTLEGVVFDATLETAIFIAEFARAHAGSERISQFKIECHRSELYKEQTHMQFTVEPLHPNGKSLEVRLELGDFLIMSGASFGVIKRRMFREYWTEA